MSVPIRRFPLVACIGVIAVVLLPLGAQVRSESRPATRPAQTAFVWPCEGYRAALRGKGNFGVLIHAERGSPFDGTWHLAEDVWVAARTPVVSVAKGKVVYSDWSPTWTEKNGTKHWNLGNVIVIEHALAVPEGELTHVCSVYIHLGNDRRVRTGDAVEMGQRIGSIGADRSAENGEYPAHLHFGIHRGPYLQIAPSFERHLLAEAAATGLPVADANPDHMKMVKGHPVMHRLGDTDVELRFPSRERSIMSLLTGSTAPDPKPADIIHWCSGYGAKDEVAEWIRPSEWIEQRRATAGR